MEAVKIDQPDKETIARNVLFNEFCKKYHEFAAFVQSLPIEQEMKAKVALYMDTGFLWTKEAFMLAEIQHKAKLSAVPDPAKDDVERPDAPPPSE